MISSDLEYFDPLSESFSQSIQLNECVNYSNSYNSTPKFYNINLVLDSLNDKSQNSNITNETPSREIDLATINSKIDPRSKSGYHNIGTKLSSNEPNSRYINGYNSPASKRPFSFTVYKDNENDKIKITKMGRFSIIQHTHNDRNTDGGEVQNVEQNRNQPQTKTDIALQNDLIVIC